MSPEMPRENSEAPKQHAAEHAAYMESRMSEKDQSIARQEAIQAEIDKLKGGKNAGVEVARSKDDAGAIQLGIELRAATNAEIERLRSEHAALGKRILELGGEPKELVEDSDSLDFVN